MKTKTNINKSSRMSWFPDILPVKSLILFILILAGTFTTLFAQDAQFTKPSWWFGAAGGANLNFYRGSTQELNSDLTVPTAFHDGFGAGLYLAPLIEYHAPGTMLGIMLQAGFDSREGEFKQVTTPCNCPADLNTELSYFTIEPSIRFAPFKSDFYLYAGPRMAFILDQSFTYKQKPNPDVPNQVASPKVNGDFSNVNKTQISMQIGAGYDIPISSQNHQTQFVLSPFVSFQPYFGQTPRSIETWNITTLRVGAAFKIGRGSKISTPVKDVVSMPAKEGVKDAEVHFSVNAPKNIPVDRKVRETFPLRNYVFFNLGSTEIPDRYELLTKDQVKDFKEDQLEAFKPKKLSGRSDRQMIVYYNVLNILGDRMGKNPSTTINLVGSSEKGPDDGKIMAESIRQYLVSVFGINASRISTEGRDKPKIPSEQPGSTKQLDLLREGDRRVSIESSSPSLLMEFQSGPSAPLKPVEIISLQDAPLDSYISFNVESANETVSSWTLEIRDDKGEVQYFGPYKKEHVSFPGKLILGTRPEGDYKVTMIGNTKSGKTVRKEANVHMVLWTPPKNEEGMRFSVIFEFNESKTITIYEKYLTDVVVPKIPKGALVIIHGYTDIIGDEDYNLKLSVARANDVKDIIANGLTKAGRTDVKFDVYGFGEDVNLSPFNNTFPEERFYNRTVIIDIIPQ
ncbi:MAG: outer membrane beta-barrel protein [Bacteroidia bacterium]|nr:outer membrane beta-barrel protein [Bacteroidia bacterium]